MTATVRAALVGASAVATNHTTTAGSSSIAQAPAVHFNRFAALSMLESGDCDTCVGPNGEMSRYQVAPTVWKQFALSGEEPTHEQDARAVSARILQQRCSAFAARYGRPPTDFEFYLLWHRPARVHNPTTREAERAHRFSNLCQ